MIVDICQLQTQTPSSSKFSHKIGKHSKTSTRYKRRRKSNVTQVSVAFSVHKIFQFKLKFLIHLYFSYSSSSIHVTIRHFFQK